MKPETFTTHSLPVPDQFDAWRDWLHSVFDVLPREPLDSGFPANGSYDKSGDEAGAYLNWPDKPSGAAVIIRQIEPPCRHVLEPLCQADKCHRRCYGARSYRHGPKVSGPQQEITDRLRRQG